MSTAQWKIGTNEVGLCPPHQVSAIPTPAEPTLAEEGQNEDASATDDCPATDDCAAAGDSAPTPRPLHRLQTARTQQGVSIRTVARHLGITIEEARAQEHETADLSLATLHRWQQLLEVPIANLLVDLDGPLSEPVLKRARMLKLMKTAGAIVQQANSARVSRLANMLVDQLVEIMPELKDVSPWHVVGQRRSLDEYGRAAERTLPDTLFLDPGC